MAAAAAELQRGKNSVFGSPAIDCDLHVSVPSIKALVPYLDAYWRQQFLTRGIDKLSWNMTSEPPNAPKPPGCASPPMRSRRSR